MESNEDESHNWVKNEAIANKATSKDRISLKKRHRKYNKYSNESRTKSTETHKTIIEPVRTKVDCLYKVNKVDHYISFTEQWTK